MADMLVQLLIKQGTLQSQGLGEIKNQLKTLKEQTLGTEKHLYLSPEIYAEFDSALSTLEVVWRSFLTRQIFSNQKCQARLTKD